MKNVAFSPEDARDRLVAALKELAREQGFSKVVVGISGGKDSTVTAAICARALGRENVYGIMLPDGEQKDIADSRRVCEALGIHFRTVNIGKMHDALRDAVFRSPEIAEDGDFPVPDSRESDINVGPRLRMTTLRYIAQAIGARLAGTGNLSEATVGYCTKDGDTSCDFSMLGALTSIEVVQVGLAMPEIPADLVRKTPTDGLSGVSDEEKLGIRYQDIHSYIRSGSCGNPEIDAKIAQKEAAGMHKRRMPRILDPFEAGDGNA
ncbi:MAG: NAD(+) synthase [Clostridia bacterium]|nr:NAD(+) synthase [Clostridia bacterium]